ncbi:MaoC/PaaZ C-terminal domain-containing protein [Xanthobacter sp. DSM 24535]|uniref:MaoC/PaaZ C-terminal domain-containing protein n=1 Tax=Roseixanthobacter psychrophilus TaxID=3119917 RepID=UPI00372CAF43
MTAQASHWRVGETHEFTTAPVTTIQLVQYAGASDDYNRIHYEEAFAVRAGLGGVIAHGMLTMAFVGRAVTDWIGPRGEVKRLSVRFTSPVRPGDAVCVKARVMEAAESAGDALVRLDLAAYVQDRIVATGGARVRIPGGQRSPVPHAAHADSVEEP